MAKFADAHSSGILNAGYKVSTSHCGPQTVKTDAPSHIVWDVMRAWVQASKY